MGIGRFFKSMFDTEVLGEETISTLEKMYRSVRAQFPHEDPHTLLARVWLARAAANGTLSSMGEGAASAAMSETQQFACVPAPDNARALGLYFIFKERPDILHQHPKFQREFETLMGPVFAAIESGQIESLYSKHNPNVDWTFVSPI